MRATEPTLSVLGLGNTLKGDDGIGVRLIADMANSASDFPGIEFIDGGVAGLGLLNYLERSPALLTIDAADMKLSPGSHRWITPRSIVQNDSPSLSLHSVDFAQTLMYAEKLFPLPATVILAIQPQSIQLSDRLTPLLESALPHLINELRESFNKWISNHTSFFQRLSSVDPAHKDQLLLEYLMP